MSYRGVCTGAQHCKRQVKGPASGLMDGLYKDTGEKSAMKQVASGYYASAKPDSVVYDLRQPQCNVLDHRGCDRRIYHSKSNCRRHINGCSNLASSIQNLDLKFT